MRVVLSRVIRSSFIVNLLIILSASMTIGLANPAAAQTLAQFDFETSPGAVVIEPVFTDAASGFTLSHTAGAVRGNTQWGQNPVCLPHAGAGCMRLSDLGVGATAVTGTINFSQPVDSVSLWVQSFALPATITPIVEGGGLLAPIAVTNIYEQYTISNNGPYIGLLMSAPAVNSFFWDDLQVTFGAPAIARDSLLGAESETGHLLAVEPVDATGTVLGDSGIVPLTALSKDPITGILYGGGQLLDPPILFTYQTTLDLAPSVDGIDTVVIDWITPQNFGNVGVADLTFLSIALLEGTDNLYTDIPIIGGIVQPIGGAPRVLADLVWEFRHGTNELFQVRNTRGPARSASLGTQYQINDNLDIPTDGQLFLQRFFDGNVAGPADLADVLVQDTRLLRIENAPSLYEIDETTGASIQLGILGTDIVSFNAADSDAEGTLWASVTVEDGCNGPCNFVNLIANPGFEGGPAGWTFTGDPNIGQNAGTCESPCVIARTGTWAGFKNLFVGGAGTISQSVPTIVGHRYRVEVWLADNTFEQGAVTVEFGTTLGVTATQNDTSPIYRQFLFEHVATSTSTDFVFGGAVTAGTFFIDDVSVTDLDSPVNFAEIEALAMIDKTDGSASIVGLGLGADCIDGISFDSVGTLWGVSSCDNNLYQIDLVTGQAQLISGLFVAPAGGPVPAGGFQSLQFACEFEGVTTLFAGIGEDLGGDGGDLYTIDTVSGVAARVGNASATDGSSLGALALHTTCGNSVSNSPTPIGENVTVISVQAFEQVAANVVVAGSTNASFCVVPDIRYVGNNFVARNLSLSELTGLGSCTGPVVPGEPETWEADIFPNINLVIASWFRSYLGEFTLPGDVTPTEGYWLVLGVVRSTAEFDGPVSYVTFPETLINYNNTVPAETPGCDRDLAWRNLDIAGAVPAFGDFPNFEGSRMIVETAQCNRSRSMTRRTTHVYPMRYVYPKAGARAELMNIVAQVSGISGTLREAASCADPALLADMQGSLRTAYMAQRMGQFANAEEAFEEIARSAKNAESFGTGFTNCPIARNYRGNFMSRGITAAFTTHDRFEHAAAFVKYFVPADLEIPLLDAQ